MILYSMQLEIFLPGLCSVCLWAFWEYVAYYHSEYCVKCIQLSFSIIQYIKNNLEDLTNIKAALSQTSFTEIL